MITAGRFKGVALAVATDRVTRPMRSRLRESLFASLGDLVTGAEVLDLFAGSGSLGLEALSRGAARCTFVERDSRALRAIRTNLERCGLGREQTRARLVAASVDAYRTPAGCRFDLVFLDPPFARIADPPPVLSDASALADHAHLVLQVPAERLPPPRVGLFALSEERGAGTSTLAVYSFGLDANT